MLVSLYKATPKKVRRVPPKKKKKKKKKKKRKRGSTYLCHRGGGLDFRPSMAFISGLCTLQKRTSHPLLPPSTAYVFGGPVPSLPSPKSRAPPSRELSASRGWAVSNFLGVALCEAWGLVDGNFDQLPEVGERARGAREASDFPSGLLRRRKEGRAKWVWVKMKPPGIGPQGLGLCFHLPGQAMLGTWFFDPQPSEPSNRKSSAEVSEKRRVFEV